MAYINGNPYTGFKGINIQGSNDHATGASTGGYLRFGGTVTASLSDSGDLGIYPEYNGTRVNLKFWNGNVEANLDPAIMRVTTITATATLTVDQGGLIKVSGISSSITITFPSASTCPGLTYTIVSAVPYKVTIATDGTDEIDQSGVTKLYGDNHINASGDMWAFCSDGSGTWYTVSRYIH